jgi:hypothetical protein
LIDEAQVRQGDDLRQYQALRRESILKGEWTEALDPVTLLDVAPSAAYGDHSADSIRIWLLERLPTEATSPKKGTPR